MVYLTRLFINNLIFVKIFIWLRGLLSENRIPGTLFGRLKHYLPELSENTPDIKAINKHLKNDINYLNSREELLRFNQLKSGQNNKGRHNLPLLGITLHNDPVIKYNQVTIISYQDIVELDSIRDRILILDIDMESDKPGICNNLKYHTKEPFHYKISLSTLSISC